MPFTDHKPFPTSKICTSREHNPPSHICLPAGTHSWQCPQCGFVTVFIVNSPVWTTPNEPRCWLASA